MKKSKMGKVKSYQELFLQVLREYADLGQPKDNIETEIIHDPLINHFELSQTGWEDEHRISGTVIHIDIRNDKIHIQYDGTEPGVARRLVELGVPKTDIVLAFQSPFMRQFTEYAVN